MEEALSADSPPSLIGAGNWSRIEYSAWRAAQAQALTQGVVETATAFEPGILAP
jgi:hypothetical protein